MSFFQKVQLLLAAMKKPRIAAMTTLGYNLLNPLGYLQVRTMP